MIHRTYDLPLARIERQGSNQGATDDRYEYITEKRNALEPWERRLDEIAKGKTTDSNVLPIKRKNLSNSSLSD